MVVTLRSSDKKASLRSSKRTASFNSTTRARKTSRTSSESRTKRAARKAAPAAKSPRSTAPSPVESIKDPEAGSETENGQAQSVHATRRSLKRKAEAAASETTSGSSPKKRQRTETSGSDGEIDTSLNGLKKALEQLAQREAQLESRERKVSQREQQVTKRENSAQALSLTMKTLKEDMQALQDERDMFAVLYEQAENESREAAKRPDDTVVSLQWLLEHLDEQYQCSLCFEVVANPYELNNKRCGHTFCAICILKWAFALLHRECGHWHDALECPLCRAPLPLAEIDAPRDVHSFPFIPNRLVDGNVKKFLDVLKDAADGKAPSACPLASGGWCGRVDDQVRAWGKGKPARVEWETRERVGKKEMTRLGDRWTNLDETAFVTFKDRIRAL